MKKIILLFLVFWLSQTTKAQFGNIPIKEMYDFYGDYYLNESDMASPNNKFGGFGDATTESWQGLLDMYRATKDKAYLIKFAKIAMWVESNRADRSPINTNTVFNLFQYPPWTTNVTFPSIPPLWFDRNSVTITSGSNTTAVGGASAHYFNGMILSGLTEFVNLVNNEFPSVRNESIIDATTGYSVLFGPPSAPFDYNLNLNPSTLGEFVDWLLTEIDLSMPVFVQWKWIGNNFVDEVAAATGNYSRLDGINIQGVCSSALYFYGKLRPTYHVQVYDTHTHNYYANNNTNYSSNYYPNNNINPGFYILKTYMEMASDVGSFYKGDRSVVSCLVNNNIPYNLPVSFTTEPIFMDRGAPFNSFKWRYEIFNGECINGLSNGELDHLDFEDISHAVNTLQFVYRTYNGLNFTNTSNLIFDDNFMIKLHNTFTENIVATYDPNACGTIFNSGVDADNTVGYNSPYNGPLPVTTPGSYKESAFSYMPLEKFDGFAGSVNSVYQILMNQFKNKCLFNAGSCGTYHLGLARCAKAQWEKECVNSTLYNRHLVYDQDFIVNNKITIDPGYINVNLNEYPFYGLPFSVPASSFADPQISSHDFIIYSGVTSTMQAGEDISFKQGFEVRSGANLHALIQSGACTDGLRTVNPNITPNIETKNANVVSNNLKSFSIQPNPNNGEFIIYNMSFEKEEYSIIITDMVGKNIYNNKSSEQKLNINLSNQPKGIYFVKIFNGNTTQVQKMIIE